VSLESTIYWSLAAVIVAAVVLPYLHSFRRRVARDRERKAEAARLGIDRPVAQFPFVDALSCMRRTGDRRGHGGGHQRTAVRRPRPL